MSDASDGSELPRVDAATRPTHLVLLVHGINTRGYWTSEIKAALEEAGFIAEPCGYGVYGVARFLLPVQSLRDKAIERVRLRVDTALEIHQPERVSVIAHSFGSYVVAHLMAKQFRQKWHRLIFCGSVNDQAFPLEQYLARFKTPILNDIGTKDVLPALAERVTWGYGAIGSYGTQSAAVHDRWHKGFGHSDFLNEAFCRKFWIPFLTDDILVKGDKPERPSRWARVLLWLPLRWIVLLLVLLVAASLGTMAYAVLQGPQLPYERRYRSPQVTVGGLPHLGSAVGEMAEDMRNNCSLGWLERISQRQSCVPVDVSGEVHALRSCTAFDYAVERPEDAVRQAARQFACLDVTERFGSMTVSVRPDAPRWTDAAGAEWVLCGCSSQQLASLNAGGR